MDLGSILYNPAVNWAIAIVYLLWGPALVIYLIFRLIGFRGYMSLFRYAGGETFLYRLDPRVKILLSIVVTTVAAMTVWWTSAVLFIAVMALYAFTSNVREKMKIVAPLVLASFIGTAWVQLPPLGPASSVGHWPHSRGRSRLSGREQEPSAPRRGAQLPHHISSDFEGSKSISPKRTTLFARPRSRAGALSARTARL